MPDTNLAEQIKTMLEEVKGQLETKTEDGQVIKLLDIFKAFPVLQEKYSSLEKRLEEFEKQAKERKWATGLAGLELEKDKFSLCRALHAMRTGNWDKAQFEAEVFRQTRALSTGDDSDGGYLVPAQAMPEFIEMFRAEAVCIRMGARVIDGLTGAPVTFTRQTGGATAYWVGENKEITESALNVGQLKMIPKKVAALTKLSNELIRMSNPGAEAMVRQDFAIALGLAVDLATLRGSGSENQPLGIANTPDINTVILGDNGATPDFDTFTDMEYELSVDNALRGNLGIVFHPAIRRLLKKLKVKQYANDPAGEFVIAPFSDAQLEAYLGYKFGMTTLIPTDLKKGNATNCTELYFGNWAEVLIGQWLGFEILASNVAGTAFAADQTWVRIISQVDIALRHAASMCLCSDAKIA
jgi:HK97 family phage major capsid protein